MARRNWLAVLVLCVACVPVSLFAEAAAEDAQRARRVTFDIVLSDGQPLRMTVAEGDVGRIQRHSDGLTLGVRPIIVDAQRGEVQVDIFGITKGEGRALQERYASSFELRQGEMPKRVDSGDEFAWNRGVFAPELRAAAVEPLLREVTVLGIDLPTEKKLLEGGTCSNAKTADASLLRPAADAVAKPCSRCCVTCGGVTACGCAVSMDCGSCCCDPCC